MPEPCYAEKRRERQAPDHQGPGPLPGVHELTPVAASESAFRDTSGDERHVRAMLDRACLGRSRRRREAWVPEFEESVDPS